MIKKTVYDIGHQFINQSGREGEIVEKIDDKYYTVKFLQTNNYVMASWFSIRNKAAQDFCADKYLGVGTAKGSAIKPFNPNTDAFRQWCSILQRCYGDKIKGNYKNCKVCDEWLEYMNFQLWFEEHVVPVRMKYPDIQMVIDKDLLSDYDNKVYSPQNCCVVPNAFNTAFQNIGWRNGILIGMSERKATTLKSLIVKFKNVLKPNILNLIQQAIQIAPTNEKQSKIKSVPKNNNSQEDAKVFKKHNRVKRTSEWTRLKSDFVLHQENGFFAQIIVEGKVFQTIDIGRLKSIIRDLEKQDKFISQ